MEHHVLPMFAVEPICLILCQSLPKFLCILSKATTEEDKIMHHVNNKKSSTFKFTPEDPEVIVHYHGSHGTEGTRNMTMLVPEYNITVRFRFSGHMILTDNWGGFSSMLREDSQNYELDCLFGIESEYYSSCPLPDVLIFQSAAHDRAYPSDYRKYLHILFAKMRNLVDRNHKHTRGTIAQNFTNTDMPEFAGRQEFVQLVQRFNKIAQKECIKYNIRFIDNAAEAEKLVEM
eukprot:gene32885-43981_t